MLETTAFALGAISTAIAIWLIASEFSRKRRGATIGGTLKSTVSYGFWLWFVLGVGLIWIALS